MSSLSISRSSISNCSSKTRNGKGCSSSRTRRSSSERNIVIYTRSISTSIVRNSSSNGRTSTEIFASAPAPPTISKVGAVEYNVPGSSTVRDSITPDFLPKTAVKLAGVVGDPPLTLTVGVIEYPSPALLIVTLATPYPRADVAVAPVPSPVIVTVGALAYPDPASEAIIS